MLLAVLTSDTRASSLPGKSSMAAIRKFMKRPPAKVSKPASCPGCGTCQALPVEGDAVKHEGRGKPVEEHYEGFDPQPVEIIRNLPGRG